jgi:hypothetical protein
MSVKERGHAVYLRSLRAILLFTILICLIVLPDVLSANAKVPSKRIGRSFQPTRNGVVVPERINTVGLKQEKITNTQPATTGNPLPVSTKRSRIPYPSNVVRVPAATNTDPSANEGLSLGQPKPDASGVGGIDNYIETVEGGIAIYDRNGNREFETTYQSWFNLPSAQFHDPVSMWDDTGNRFIFSILDQGTPYILVSVAQQTNATGQYCTYAFSDLQNHDFDKLGVDSDGIYVTANILAQNSEQVVNNELFYANRAAMENCQKVSYSNWDGLTNPDGTLAQAINPARQDSSTQGIEYLVNSYPLGACKLTLWTLTSSGNLSNTSIATQCYSPPPQAVQKGSSTRIATSDCSVTQASYVNGMLTLDTPGAYDWKDGNGQVSIVEWYVLNPSTATVDKQGAFGTPGYWLFFPSTITTANGHMLFVYSASGPNIYPSVWYVNQNLKDTTALANGNGFYTYEGLHVSPWGDYQSAWPDANSIDANAVWMTGIYAMSKNSWGTMFDVVTP